MTRRSNPVQIVVSGIPSVDDAYVQGAVEVAARHPSFNYRNWFDTPTSRVSDFITPGRFWDTDVWVRMHGHVNARYPAAVNLGSHGGVAVFLGVQRTHNDFTDEDIEVLDLDPRTAHCRVGLPKRLGHRDAAASAHRHAAGQGVAHPT